MVKGILLLFPTLLLVTLILSSRCGIRARKGGVAEFASMTAQWFEAEHHRLPTENELKAEMRSADPRVNLEPDDHIVILWADESKNPDRVPGSRGLTVIFRSQGEEIKHTELVQVR